MAVDKNKIIAEATKLVQKGAYDKAIKTYEKILAEDAKDVRILLKVGELHQKKGDDKAAAAAFQKVAETYAEQGFFLKSVAVYKQIVKLDPDDLRVERAARGALPAARAHERRDGAAPDRRGRVREGGRRSPGSPRSSGGWSTSTRTTSRPRSSWARCRRGRASRRPRSSASAGRPTT